MSCNSISNETISSITNFLLTGILETENGIWNVCHITEPILSQVSEFLDLRNNWEPGLSIARAIRALNEEEFEGIYPTKLISDNFPTFCYSDSYGFKSPVQLVRSLDFVEYNCINSDLIHALIRLRAAIAIEIVRDSDEYGKTQWQ